MTAVTLRPETRTVSTAERIAHQRPGYSLEQAFYTSPEFFALDLERIFARHWLLAGASCRLKSAGDYFT